MSYIILIASICITNQCIDVSVYDIPAQTDSEYVAAIEQCQQDKRTLADQGTYSYCHIVND